MGVILGFVGIIVALILFLVLVYRGWSSYWVGLICALIVVATNQLDFTKSITQSYVGGIANLVTTLFLMILLGAMLGKVFADTGAAASIVKTLTNKLVIGRKGDTQIRMALLSILIISASCTMGGIGAYVLTFTLFPICLVMAEMVDIPRRFIPGMISLNCAFLAAPGAPQVNNIIAKAALEVLDYEVSKFAGLIPGIISTIIIAAGGFFTLSYMIIKAKRNGEHFEFGKIEKTIDNSDRNLPNFFIALTPLLTVFVVYMIVGLDIFYALIAGILVNLLLMGRNLPRKDSIGKAIVNTLNAGALQAPNALINVITPAGLATVIMGTAVYGILVKKLYGLNIHYIILTILVVCIVGCLTSSPPAALFVAIPLVVSVIVTQGGVVNANAIARIAAISSTTFLTLPINGFIVLTLSLAKTSHKESYKVLFYMTFAWTFVGAVVAGFILMLFPSLA